MLDNRICLVKECDRPSQRGGMCEPHDALVAALHRENVRTALDLDAYLSDEKCPRGHWKAGANIFTNSMFPGRYYCRVCAKAKTVQSQKAKAGEEATLSEVLGTLWLEAQSEKGSSLTKAFESALAESFDDASAVTTARRQVSPEDRRAHDLLQMQELGVTKENCRTCMYGHQIYGANLHVNAVGKMTCKMCWMGKKKLGQWTKETELIETIEEAFTALEKDCKPGSRTEEVVRDALGKGDQS